MQRGLLALAVLLACASVASAEEDVPRIRPMPALDAAVAEIARTSDQVAEGTVRGGGRWLRLSTTNIEPIVVFVAPLLGDGSSAAYNPADMLRFQVPAAERGATVDVDLSVSPSWNATQKDYILTLVSPATATPPAVLGIEILPATFGDSMRAAVAHAFQSESFVISTYHHLRGYRVLGHASLPWLTLLLLIVGAGILVYRKRASVPVLVLLLGGAHFLYSSKIDLDLLRLSAAHADAWITSGAYGEAGDTYALADQVAAEAATTPHLSLAVCFDSTDYYAKLLRYLLLPLLVQMGTEHAEDATHVAVVRKIDWSYENGRLRCGSINTPATLLRAFPDGSRLFSLRAP